MMDAGRHPNITLLTYSEVANVSGYVGNYKVTIKKKPRYVKEELCVGCLQCIDGCTYKDARFPDEFQMGLGKRKPVYLPFAQATPQVVVIDPDRCIELKTGKCKKTCVEICDERNAIDFEQKEETSRSQVGAIIVATGFAAFRCHEAPLLRLWQVSERLYRHWKWRGSRALPVRRAARSSFGTADIRKGWHHPLRRPRDENTNR